MTIVTRWSPPKNPWERAELTDYEVMAIKSVSAGVATKDQQITALSVIVRKFARTYDMTFRPGGAEGDRATQFAEGMRSVGSAITEITERPMRPSGDQPNDDAKRAATRRNPKPSRPTGKPTKPTVPE